MSRTRPSVKDRAAAKAIKEPVYFLERKIDKVPYITGFCGNGWCEGTKKISVNGSLLRACSGLFVIQGKTYECKHVCHEVFRQIAEMTGLTTQASLPTDLIGSLWGPANGLLHSPSPDTRNDGETPVATTTEAATRAPVAIAPGVSSLRPLLPSPLLASEHFSPTPSGQRARGQLEAEVANIAVRWFAGQEAMPLTPDNVRAGIKTEPSPSNGAIYSIFKRWETQAYCNLADKPFRMVSLDERGKRYLSRWA